MEAIHLKTGQRISYRVVQAWDMFGSEGKVMYQGQNGNGAHQIHDPGGLGTFRINYGDNR